MCVCVCVCAFAFAQNCRLPCLFCILSRTALAGNVTHDRPCVEPPCTLHGAQLFRAPTMMRATRH